jgi:hypothetical protein
MEELGSLDKALHDVPHLDKREKDSLNVIEGTYGKIFKSYGIAAKTKVDSARAAGGSPDMDEIRALRVEADSVRTRELTVARAVLTTDEQRSRFDQNVVDIKAEEAKRVDEMRNRRRPRGMGMGAGG